LSVSIAAVWSNEPESLDDVESLGAVGSRNSGVSSLRGVSLMVVRPFGRRPVQWQI